MIWRTVKETASHKYQQQMLTGKRRAVKKDGDVGSPFHTHWLRGGEFRKGRSSGAKPELEAK